MGQNTHGVGNLVYFLEIQEGDEDLFVGGEDGGPGVSVARAADAEVVGGGVFYDVNGNGVNGEVKVVESSKEGLPRIFEDEGEERTMEVSC